MPTFSFCSAAKQAAAFLAAALSLDLMSGYAAAQDVCPRPVDPTRPVAGDIELADDLGALHGFAKLAGTTGGQGRQVFVVDTPGDTVTAPAPGSLRAQIEAARAAGGGTIVFANPSAAQLTIELTAAIEVPPNVTIDGGCARVLITGNEDISLLRIEETNNVIIRRLKFRKNDQCPSGRDASGACALEQDAIFVRPPADRIWIAQNLFSHCGDGCVDIASTEPILQTSRVTVAYNRFQNHNKTMLLGDLSCLDVASELPGCDLSSNAELTLFVTLERNGFVGTTQRHPKAGARTYVHSSGNIIFNRAFVGADGRTVANYGMLAANGGRILSEGDIIRPLETDRPSLGIYALTEPQRQLSPTTLSEGPGATRIVGGNFLKSVTNIQNSPQLVPDPPYDDVVPPKFGSLNIFAAGRHAQCVLARVGVNPQIGPAVECR